MSLDSPNTLLSSEDRNTYLSRIHELEEQLKHQQEQQKAIILAAGQLVWTTEPDGYAHDSFSWREFTGQTAREMEGFGWLDAVHPADRDELQQRWGEALKRRTIYQHKYRIRRYDGVYRLFLVKAVPIFDKQGGMKEWVGSSSDITDYNQLTQDLQSLEKVTDAALAYLSLDSLLIEMLKRVNEIFSADSSAILLLASDRTELVVSAVIGLEGEVAVGVHVPFGKGISGTIAATGQPLILKNISQNRPEETYLFHKVASLVGVPLIVEGKVIGVIHVDSATPREFIQEDADLLQHVADRAALAIEYNRIYKEASDRAAELNSIIDASKDGIIFYDKEGYPRVLNQAAMDILGFDEVAAGEFKRVSVKNEPSFFELKDFSGQPVETGARPAIRALHGEQITNKKTFDVLLTNYRGKQLAISSTGAPLLNEKGEVDGAVITMRDITEQQKAAKRNQDALTALMEVAGVLVEVPNISAASSLAQGTAKGEVDTSTHSFAHDIAQKLLRLAMTLLACKSAGIVRIDHDTGKLEPVAMDGLDEQYLQIYKQEISVLSMSDYLDESMIRQLYDGKPVLYDLEKHPFAYRSSYGMESFLAFPMRSGGQLIGALLLELAQGLEKYTPEVMDMAQAIANNAVIALERENLIHQFIDSAVREMSLLQTNHLMDEFLSIASHELKTPLTSIKANIQLVDRRLKKIMMQVSDSPLTESLEVAGHLLTSANTQSGRLTRIINDLLDVSRVQSGKLPLHIEECDLIDIIQDTVEQQTLAWPEREIKIVYPLGQQVPVKLDCERISQVVTNFLANAIKYSPEDTPIEVGINVSDSDYHVWVKDQGPGLSPQDQEHIWERFYRVLGSENQDTHDMQTKTAGLGLGLYICKSIIHQHGGAIGVSSQPGKGSTFWFDLPREADGISRAG